MIKRSKLWLDVPWRANTLFTSKKTKAEIADPAGSAPIRRTYLASWRRRPTSPSRSFAGRWGKGLIVAATVVHKHTVKRWIKGGLPLVAHKRPLLFTERSAYIPCGATAAQAAVFRNAIDPVAGVRFGRKLMDMTRDAVRQFKEHVPTQIGVKLSRLHCRTGGMFFLSIRTCRHPGPLSHRARLGPGPVCR
jgi:hypothetical protein